MEELLRTLVGRTVTVRLAGMKEWLNGVLGFVTKKDAVDVFQLERAAGGNRGPSVSYFLAEDVQLVGVEQP